MKEEGINKGGAQSSYPTGNTDNDCFRPRAAGVADQEQQGLEVKLGQALEGRGGVEGRKCVLAGSPARVEDCEPLLLYRTLGRGQPNLLLEMIVTQLLY